MLEAADRIGLRSEVEDQLPADVGTIEILRSDELDTAQDSFQLLKTLAWVLPLLALAAFALGAWLSGDRRRAMRRIGITALVVGVLGIVAANVVGAYVVDSLVAETENRTAAGNAWDILSELLRSSYRWLVVGGVLFLVAAWLAGPGRWAVASAASRSRRRSGSGSGHTRRSPFSRSSCSSRGPVGDFARYLVRAGVRRARRRSGSSSCGRRRSREFPDATAPELFADARSRVTGWWEARRAGAASASPHRRRLRDDIASRLASLADLHARGELTRRGVRLGQGPRTRRRVGGQAPGGGRRIHGHGFVQPGGGGTRPRGHLALRRGRSALRALLRVCALRAPPRGARSVRRRAPSNDLQLPPADRDGADRPDRRLERALRLPHDRRRSRGRSSRRAPCSRSSPGSRSRRRSETSARGCSSRSPSRCDSVTGVTVGEHTGVVERISLSYTALVTDEGPHVFVPNQMMVSTTLVNRTRGAG